ncbi:hypothetical protein BMS3Bbin12_01854 [bacterium BMS3Bbin12]|nr:hypothetical protein BMS3Bbin12_01854 [bacterium BMS3Bbin12]
MRVAVTLAVAQRLHEPRRRVAQVRRDLQRTVTARIRTRRLKGGVDGVALRCAGQIDHRLCERQFALGAAEALLRLPGVQGQCERTRVGVADVLGGHAHHPPGDVAGIAAAVQHARQPVERRIRRRAAHRFVQRRDLVVEGVTTLVEAAHPARRDFAYDRLVDHLGLARGDGQIGGGLEQVQHTASVTVGGRGEGVAPGLGDLQRTPAQSAIRVLQGLVEDAPQFGRRQGLEHVGPGAREQSVVQCEGRVLGGRADEDQRAVLDVREEGILLRDIETVHLVDEQHRAPALAERGPRPLDRLTDILDAGEHRRELQELRPAGVGHEPRERGLAAARRPPQHHRVQAARDDRLAQRLAGCEQMDLAGELLQRARTHAVGQGTGIRGHGGHRRCAFHIRRLRVAAYPPRPRPAAA